MTNVDTITFETKADEMVHFTLKDGMVRGLLISGTNLVREAARIHHTSPVATAALGRALMGTAMLSATLKDDISSVTVTLDGGGPLGRVVCVGDKGAVRGLVDHPDVQLPLRKDGKLDVGMAVGHQGRMTVVKDLGMKTPYVGQTAMVSGEIAEDFAAYYVQSEQKPTLQSLGVLVSGNAVLRAGGILLQPMPGCDNATIEELELRSPMLGDISREMCYEPLEDLAASWFAGMGYVALEREAVTYRCTCNRARMEKALVSLGREELQQMIDDEQDGAELRCHFCHKAERFTQEDLGRLLAQAVTEEESDE